jgi:hypothetical protein
LIWDILLAAGFPVALTATLGARILSLSVTILVLLPSIIVRLLAFVPSFPWAAWCEALAPVRAANMQCRRASRGFARALLAETFRPHFGAYTVTMNIAAELPAEGVGPEPFHIICENDIIRLHNLRRLSLIRALPFAPVAQFY